MTTTTGAPEELIKETLFRFAYRVVVEEARTDKRIRSVGGVATRRIELGRFDDVRRALVSVAAAHPGVTDADDLLRRLGEHQAELVPVSSKPDPDCKLCEGQGQILDGNVARRCPCVVRADADPPDLSPDEETNIDHVNGLLADLVRMTSS